MELQLQQQQDSGSADSALNGDSWPVATNKGTWIVGRNETRARTLYERTRGERGANGAALDVCAEGMTSSEHERLGETRTLQRIYEVALLALLLGRPTGPHGLHLARWC